ncbi:hypothetical protein [uncultured Nocardioides sp.]|uniref:DUF7927 domain-containing protein n=1 Tax=uncultured Nocardioides sp. TaxID=198441 RepID=UPI0026294A1D|nr:hypothetical protein [uncultured Nocardioides sp.]
MPTRRGGQTWRWPSSVAALTIAALVPVVAGVAPMPVAAQATVAHATPLVSQLAARAELGDAIRCDRMYSAHRRTGSPLDQVRVLEIEPDGSTSINTLAPQPVHQPPNRLIESDAIAVDEARNQFFLIQSRYATGLNFDDPSLLRVDASTGLVVETLLDIPVPAAGEFGMGPAAFDRRTGILYFTTILVTGEIGSRTTETTIYAFDPTTDTMLPGVIGRLDDLMFVGSMWFDEAGRLWVATFGDGLHRVDVPLPRTGTTPGQQLPTTRFPLNGAMIGQATGPDGLLYSLDLPEGHVPEFIRGVEPASLDTASYGPVDSPLFDFYNSASGLSSCATPSTMRLVADLPQGRIGAADQFRVRITGNDLDSTHNTGRTQGAESGAQTQSLDEYVTPLLALHGQTYTITETALGTTDLADYTVTWECREPLRPGNPVVASGAGTTGSFTMPNYGVVGADVLCTFTNVPRPLVAVEMAKSATPASGTTVRADDVVTYTVTVRNPNRRPVPVDLIDSLGDVLDDAALEGTPVATNPDPATAPLTLTPLQGTGDSARIELSGILSRDETVTLTYRVRVKSDAQRGTDGGNNHVLNRIFDPGGPLPTGPCLATDRTCTSHPVAARAAAATEAAELRISKDVDPRDGATVRPGQTVTYTLHFRNAGGAPTTIHHLDDLTDVVDDAELLRGSITSGSLTVRVQSGNRLLISGELAPGRAQTVSYDVQVNAARKLGNSRLENFLVDADRPHHAAACPAGDATCTLNPVAGPQPQSVFLPATGGPARWAVLLGLLMVLAGGRVLSKRPLTRG